MTEHKFITMSEHYLPIHMILKVSESLNEPGNMQNIIINCTYQKKTLRDCKKCKQTNN